MNHGALPAVCLALGLLIARAVDAQGVNEANMDAASPAASPSPAEGAQGVEAAHKEEAERHFRAAVALQRVEDFEAAIAAYRHSDNLYPTKATLFNLANCLRATHRYPEALAVLERLQREFGSELVDPMRSVADSQRRELLALTAQLTVHVHGPAGQLDGATVSVDGQVVGETPLAAPLRLKLGQHQVRAEREGYTSATLEVSLMSAATVEQTLTLTPEVRGEPASTLPRTAAPTSDVAPTLERPARSTSPTDAPPATSAQRTWGWLATGTGAALLAGGAVTGYWALSLDDELQARCADGICPRRLADDVERLNTVALTTDVLLGVGAACSIVGLTLLLTSSSEDSALQVGLGVGTLTAQGTF